MSRELIGSGNGESSVSRTLDTSGSSGSEHDTCGRDFGSNLVENHNASYRGTSTVQIGSPVESCESRKNEIAGTWVLSGTEKNITPANKISKQGNKEAEKLKSAATYPFLAPKDIIQDSHCAVSGSIIVSSAERTSHIENTVLRKVEFSECWSKDPEREDSIIRPAGTYGDAGNPGGDSGAAGFLDVTYHSDSIPTQPVLDIHPIHHTPTDQEVSSDLDCFHGNIDKPNSAHSATESLISNATCPLTHEGLKFQEASRLNCTPSVISPREEESHALSSRDCTDCLQHSVTHDGVYLESVVKQSSSKLKSLKESLRKLISKARKTKIKRKASQTEPVKPLNVLQSDTKGEIKLNPCKGDIIHDRQTSTRDVSTGVQPQLTNVQAGISKQSHRGQSHTADLESGKSPGFGQQQQRDLILSENKSLAISLENESVSHGEPWTCRASSYKSGCQNLSSSTSSGSESSDSWDSDSDSTTDNSSTSSTYTSCSSQDQESKAQLSAYGYGLSEKELHCIRRLDDIILDPDWECSWTVSDSGDSIGSRAGHESSTGNQFLQTLLIVEKTDLSRERNVFPGDPDGEAELSPGYSDSVTWRNSSCHSSRKSTCGSGVSEKSPIKFQDSAFSLQSAGYRASGLDHEGLAQRNLLITSSGHSSLLADNGSREVLLYSGPQSKIEFLDCHPIREGHGFGTTLTKYEAVNGSINVDLPAEVAAISQVSVTSPQVKPKWPEEATTTGVKHNGAPTCNSLTIVESRMASQEQFMPPDLGSDPSIGILDSCTLQVADLSDALQCVKAGDKSSSFPTGCEPVTMGQEVSKDKEPSDSKNGISAAAAETRVIGYKVVVDSHSRPSDNHSRPRDNSDCACDVTATDKQRLRQATVDVTSGEAKEENVTVDAASGDTKDDNVADVTSEEIKEKTVTVDVTMVTSAAGREENVTVDVTSRETKEEKVTVNVTSGEIKEDNVTVDVTSGETRDENVTADAASGKTKDESVIVNATGGEEKKEDVTVDITNGETKEVSMTADATIGETKEENVTLDATSRDTKEENVINGEIKGKNAMVDATSAEDGEENVTVDVAGRETKEENVTVDAASGDTKEGNVTVDVITGETIEGNVTVDITSGENKDDNVTLDATSAKTEEENVTVDVTNEETKEGNLTLDVTSGKAKGEIVTVDVTKRETKEENATVDATNGKTKYENVTVDVTRGETEENDMSVGAKSGETKDENVTADTANGETNDENVTVDATHGETKDKDVTADVTSVKNKVESVTVDATSGDLTNREHATADDENGKAKEENVKVDVTSEEVKEENVIGDVAIGENMEEKVLVDFPVETRKENAEAESPAEKNDKVSAEIMVEECKEQNVIAYATGGESKGDNGIADVTCEYGKIEDDKLMRSRDIECLKFENKLSEQIDDNTPCTWAASAVHMVQLDLHAVEFVIAEDIPGCELIINQSIETLRLNLSVVSENDELNLPVLQQPQPGCDLATLGVVESESASENCDSASGVSAAENTFRGGAEHGKKQKSPEGEALESEPGLDRDLNVDLRYHTMQHATRGKSLEESGKTSPEPSEEQWPAMRPGFALCDTKHSNWCGEVRRNATGVLGCDIYYKPSNGILQQTPEEVCRSAATAANDATLNQNSCKDLDSAGKEDPTDFNSVTCDKNANMDIEGAMGTGEREGKELVASVSAAIETGPAGTIESEDLQGIAASANVAMNGSDIRPGLTSDRVLQDCCNTTAVEVNSAVTADNALADSGQSAAVATERAQCTTTTAERDEDSRSERHGASDNTVLEGNCVRMDTDVTGIESTDNASSVSVCSGLEQETSKTLPVVGVNYEANNVGSGPSCEKNPQFADDSMICIAERTSPGTGREDSVKIALISDVNNDTLTTSVTEATGGLLQNASVADTHVNAGLNDTNTEVKNEIEKSLPKPLADSKQNRLPATTLGNQVSECDCSLDGNGNRQLAVDGAVISDETDNKSSDNDKVKKKSTMVSNGTCKNNNGTSTVANTIATASNTKETTETDTIAPAATDTIAPAATDTIATAVTDTIATAATHTIATATIDTIALAATDTAISANDATATVDNDTIAPAATDTIATAATDTIAIAVTDAIATAAHHTAISATGAIATAVTDTIATAATDTITSVTDIATTAADTILTAAADNIETPTVDTAAATHPSATDPVDRAAASAKVDTVETTVAVCVDNTTKTVSDAVSTTASDTVTTDTLSRRDKKKKTESKKKRHSEHLSLSPTGLKPSPAIVPVPQSGGCTVVKETETMETTAHETEDSRSKKTKKKSKDALKKKTKIESLDLSGADIQTAVMADTQSPRLTDRYPERDVKEAFQILDHCSRTGDGAVLEVRAVVTVQDVSKALQALLDRSERGGDRTGTDKTPGQQEGAIPAGQADPADTGTCDINTEAGDTSAKLEDTSSKGRNENDCKSRDHSVKSDDNHDKTSKKKLAVTERKHASCQTTDDLLPTFCDRCEKAPGVTANEVIKQTLQGQKTVTGIRDITAKSVTGIKGNHKQTQTTLELLPTSVTENSKNLLLAVSHPIKDSKILSDPHNAAVPPGPLAAIPRAGPRPVSAGKAQQDLGKPGGSLPALPRRQAVRDVTMTTSKVDSLKRKLGWVVTAEEEDRDKVAPLQVREHSRQQSGIKRASGSTSLSTGSTCASGSAPVVGVRDMAPEVTDQPQPG